MSATGKIIAYVEGQAIPDPTECFAVPGEGHIIDCVHPITGKTVYYGKTLEDCQQEHPGAIRMTIEEFCRQKAARQDTPIEWIETTEDQYDEMLGCLPPIAFTHSGFLVGEASDHHATTGRPRYAAYIRKGDKYFTASRPMTVQEFKGRT